MPLWIDQATIFMSPWWLLWGCLFYGSNRMFAVRENASAHTTKFSLRKSMIKSVEIHCGTIVALDSSEPLIPRGYLEYCKVSTLRQLILV